MADKWITVNGTHILIKEGQSVSDAFKKTTGKSISKTSATKSASTKSAGEVVSDYKASASPHNILKDNKNAILDSIGADKKTLYGNGSNSNWDADFDVKKGNKLSETEMNKKLYDDFKKLYSKQKGFSVEGSSGKGVYVSKGNKSFFVKVEKNKHYTKGGDQGKFAIVAYNTN